MELKNKVVSTQSTEKDLETEIRYLKNDVTALKRLVKELFMINEKLGVQVEAGSVKGMFKFYFFDDKGEELEHYNYFIRTKKSDKTEEKVEDKTIEEIAKLDDEALTDYMIAKALEKKKANK